MRANTVACPPWAAAQRLGVGPAQLIWRQVEETSLVRLWPQTSPEAPAAALPRRPRLAGGTVPPPCPSDGQEATAETPFDSGMFVDLSKGR